MTSLKRAAFGDLDDELAATRRLLERVPDEHLGWRPHARSMTLGALATHLATLPYWMHTTLAEDAFDLAATPRNEALGSRAAILERFDAHAAALRAQWRDTPEATLAAPWTLRQGERVLLTQPRAAVLRGMGLSHLIHHRGQLTVYLRLLDVPLPALYGPTADEAPAF